MKRTPIAYILWIVGLHNFYLRRHLHGIIYLLTCGGLGLWALFDLFRMHQLVAIANGVAALEPRLQPAAVTANAIKPSDESEYQAAVQAAKVFISKVRPEVDARLSDFESQSGSDIKRHGIHTRSLELFKESMAIVLSTIRTETAISRFAFALENQICIVIGNGKMSYYDRQTAAKQDLIELATNADAILLGAAQREIDHETRKIDSSKTQATRDKRIAALRGKLEELEAQYGIPFSTLTLPTSVAGTQKS